MNTYKVSSVCVCVVLQIALLWEGRMCQKIMQMRNEREIKKWLISLAVFGYKRGIVIRTGATGSGPVLPLL